MLRLTILPRKQASNLVSRLIATILCFFNALIGLGSCCSYYSKYVEENLIAIFKSLSHKQHGASNTYF